ncbi:UNVERIFIED_CONTAM: hypothetical protein HDU68_004354 [Siphonaria sp. JEL0065]|nr:hypothetical protein HDU68_004354 [Siphonaria sp. JEL0065]
MAAPSLFEDYMQQAEMQVEFESLYSAPSCNSAVEYQQPLPFDFLPAGSDTATLEPDIFSYFCGLPEMDSSMLSLNMAMPINMPLNMPMPLPMLDGGFAYAPASSDNAYYYTPSPSPTLVLIETPFASLKSPPHSPNPTCLPLSFVAPSPVPLFLEQRSSSPASDKADCQLNVKSGKKSAPLKRPNATAAALKPLHLKDFLKAPSPITTECSDSSDEAESDAISVTAPVSPSKSDGQVPPFPVRRTGSSKKSSSAGVLGKKRHILKEWETEILNVAFEENQFLQTNQAAQLAERLGMTPNQVRIWFQNRRAHVKRMNSSKTDDSQDD